MNKPKTIVQKTSLEHKINFVLICPFAWGTYADYTYRLKVPSNMTAGEFERETGLKVRACILGGEWNAETYFFRQLYPCDKLPNSPVSISMEVKTKMSEEMNNEVRRRLQKYLDE